jgi:predicted nucleic acid-binding protein
MPPTVFVDAGAWIAIADESDQHYRAATRLNRQLAANRTPLVTTVLAVAEAHSLTLRRGGYERAMSFLGTLRQSSRLMCVYPDAELGNEAELLLARYSDQDFSLTDAFSFAVMRQRGIREAFAFDKHFAAAGFTLLPGGQK